jgi:hypothetical protein
MVMVVLLVWLLVIMPYQPEPWQRQTDQEDTDETQDT